MLAAADLAQDARPIKTEPVMSALNSQIGGEHYKSLPIQPVEFCQRNRLGFCESNVVKYVTRHASKGGREDLEKAKHNIDLLIELQYPDAPDDSIRR